MWQYNHSDTLYHHGIKGQRWGVRRYQNKDGSLTPAGKKRYDDGIDKKQSDDKKKLTDKQKTALKVAAVGAGITASLLAAYGVKKYVDVKSDEVIVAKGKALYDHVFATTPKPGNFGTSIAIANASSVSTEFVARKRNFMEKSDVINEYKKVTKKAKKNLPIDDLDGAWMYYMNNK